MDDDAGVRDSHNRSYAVGYADALGVDTIIEKIKRVPEQYRKYIMQFVWEKITYSIVGDFLVEPNKLRETINYIAWDIGAEDPPEKDLED